MATGRKSDFTLPTFDSIFSTQEQRDDAKLAKIRDIPLNEIDDFPDHPFKVRDDEDMMQLVESIKERGVITPATDEQAASILKDIATVKKGKKDEALAKEFLERFCEINNIELSDLPIMEGALQRKSGITTNKKATTITGFVNDNNQRNEGRLTELGTDHNQYFYQMKCLHCGHLYKANGSDIWQRKCPKCQEGKE